MPAFRTGHPRVRLRKTASQVLAAGLHAVVWDVADYDDESLWDGSSTIVLDRAGLWQLHATVLLGAVSPSFTATVRWRVNSTDLPQSRSVSNTVSNQVTNLHILELDAGDALQVIVQRSTTVASTVANDETWCHVLRVGPVRYV